ncbi:hypothetical protein AAMO2058_000065700 [Amorphochlora amoebiformis]|uniref:Protein kinase domain-containing protein n=1 Tax=Amorphochlora amoebiformis TaxID=1561963 RepID=A0A7S0GP39_9EUKA
MEHMLVHHDSVKSKSSTTRRKASIPSLFACCRPSDDSPRGSNKFPKPRLPNKYEVQFTLRRTLFGQVVCAIDREEKRRVAIKFSYKDDRFRVAGEDPRLEAKFLETLGPKATPPPSKPSTRRYPASPKTRAPVAPPSSRRIRELARCIPHSYSSNSIATTRTHSSESVCSVKSRRELAWHPHIIQLHGSFEDKEKVWTVLEFAPRGELLDHITGSPNGKLSEYEAARIVGQVASALAHCHDNNIAHLDVSPENILLSRTFDAKLCDFGLAQFMDNQGIVSRPHSTGKPNYMSPESYDVRAEAARSEWLRNRARRQKKHSKFLGAPADVYSLGIVAFLSVTGVLPYKYPTAVDKRFSLVSGGESMIKGLLKRWGISLSSPAVNILARMLARDPKNRITIPEILAHPWIAGPKSRFAA